MSDTPQFRLPQRPVTGQRDGRVVILIVLVLIMIGIQLFGMYRRGVFSAQQIDHSSTRRADRWSVDGLKSVAMKLEDRNLMSAAAEAWSEYLTLAAPPANEAAAIELRIGKLRQTAGDFERALAALYRAEQLASGNDQKLMDQIGDRIRECFQAMGRYGDLTRETAARTSLNPAQNGLSGGAVVAQIGDDKVTLADFDRLVQERIDAAIAARPGASPAEIDLMRRQIEGSLADPKAREQQLQEIVTARVLAAEARKAGLHESDAFRRELLMISESLLGSRLMSRVVGERATVTPADVERFFAANKDRYTEQASAKIAHIVCATKEAADEVLAKLDAGESFDGLAKAYSMDAATKDKGGVLDSPLTESGDMVPGVGKNADLHAAIWKLEAGAVLPEPQESAKGWEVIKLLEKRAAREIKLDDVRDEVEADVRDARRQEVAQQYVQELMATHRVQFFPQALTGGARRDSRTSDDGRTSEAATQPAKK